MGTLISEEWLYNSEAATKTFRRSFQSLSGFGSEVEGMANQTYKAQDGVYEYSGEDVYYYAGISGGGPSGGGGGGTGPDSILLTVSAAASTEPIEAHPRFDGLLTNSGWDTWNRWKANPEDPKNFGVGLTNAQGYFDPSLYTATDAYGVLYVLYMRGIREYYEPKVVVRQTRFEAGAPTLSAVGKIDSPPINPAGSGMTNYILNSADGRYNASNAVWENVYEWVGSRKGWDVNLYGAGT
jgi:hypothetical protein